jgi:hypothetical protein
MIFDLNRTGSGSLYFADHPTARSAGERSGG